MQTDAPLREALLALGASGTVLDELLAYTANPFDTVGLDNRAFPFPDAPHLEAWTEYAAEAARDGVLAMLARRLVQFRFPIEAGISTTEAYKAATRRGEWPLSAGPGIALDDPDGVELVLHQTPAGRVPVIACRTRADFVRLVQVCSCRNEPDDVPASMGACIVNGLNNWDRVGRVRRRLEAERGAPFDAAGWAEAFRTIIPQKALYQDRLILLSSEPYSAVPAADLGLADAEWRRQSVAIRREHECTHYFTLVAFGAMRNNLLDELIADAAGLAAVSGRYEADTALRFLGLEHYPAYRQGGRFENYLGTPPLSAAATELMQGIVVRAARHLEAATRHVDLADSRVRQAMVRTLAQSTLPEMAVDRDGARLRAELAAVHL